MMALLKSNAFCNRTNGIQMIFVCLVNFTTFKQNSYLSLIIKRNKCKTIIYLRREGVKELDQIESSVLYCHESSPDDPVERCPGLLQQLLQPDFNMSFCHYWLHAVDCFPFS